MMSDPLMAEPWKNEPDFHTFEAAGLRCVMKRHADWLSWCGYVGVGRSHPLFEVHYGDLVPAPANWMKQSCDVDEVGPINLFITALDLSAGDIPEGFAPLTSLITVHGGLSWANRLHDWTGWFFGFDCGHAWDYSPGFERRMKELDASRGYPSWPDAMRDYKTYRSFDYVASECATLAQQIADYGNDGSAETMRELILTLRNRAREPEGGA